jgi:two-component system, NarL family, nitrate/nitrite response regulator NarL
MAVVKSEKAAPIRVLIADDHSLVREGLRKLLQTEPGFEVAGEAADGEMLMEMIREARPDVLLLDLAMPRLSGMDVLRELANRNLSVRTLVVTASIDKSQVVQALKLGAYGVVLKESTSQRLFDSIRCVMAGQYWVGRESVSDLVKALRSVGNPADQAQRTPDFGLTRRELEIVRLVIAGYSNPDIADRCSISEQTVKHHVSNIFDKLGVSNRLELALFAVNHKLAGATPDSD